jgi:type I restriction enzyme R subunit
MFEHPFKQYVLFKDLEEKLDQRDMPGTPDRLAANPHARAYYGVFRIVLGEETFNAMSPDEVQNYVDQAFAVDEIVDKAVAENSVNPQNIESEIRKCLLPRLFKLIGIDRAKEVIAHIVQIIRVGLAKEC